MMGILRCFGIFCFSSPGEAFASCSSWRQTWCMAKNSSFAYDWAMLQNMTQGGGRKSWPPSLHHAEWYPTSFGGQKSIVRRYHGCITTLLRIVNSAKQKWDPSFNKISKCFEISSPQLNRKPFICQRDARVVARAATTCTDTQLGSIPHPGCNRHHRELLHV